MGIEEGKTDYDVMFSNEKDTMLRNLVKRLQSR
jgi:hypothetical protein